MGNSSSDEGGGHDYVGADADDYLISAGGGARGHAARAALERERALERRRVAQPPPQRGAAAEDSETKRLLRAKERQAVAAATVQAADDVRTGKVASAEAAAARPPQGAGLAAGADPARLARRRARLAARARGLGRHSMPCGSRRVSQDHRLGVPVVGGAFRGPVTAAGLLALVPVGTSVLPFLRVTAVAMRHSPARRSAAASASADAGSAGREGYQPQDPARRRPPSRRGSGAGSAAAARASRRCGGSSPAEGERLRA